MNFCFFLIAPVFSLLTYKLIKESNLTPTRVSSGLTLASLGAIHFLQTVFQFDLTPLAAFIFGATFVGMCSHKIFDYISIFIASIIYTLIFIFLKPTVLGLGGALGFSAFISIQIAWFFKRIQRRIINELN